jgi:Domain of unknown function (DUF1844)
MPDEKKIIIDEDWKTRVEAEKEAAAKSEPVTTAGESSPGTGDVADSPMPPASLELLLTTLGTEALMAMGQLPHPMTGEFHAQPNHAKYLIDMIEMLRDKTKGNLTPGEQQLIDSLLHQLRLVFVETAVQPREKTAAKAPLETG